MEERFPEEEKLMHLMCPPPTVRQACGWSHGAFTSGFSLICVLESLEIRERKTILK